MGFDVTELVLMRKPFSTLQDPQSKKRQDLGFCGKEVQRASLFAGTGKKGVEQRRGHGKLETRKRLKVKMRGLKQSGMQQEKDLKWHSVPNLYTYI